MVTLALRSAASAVLLDLAVTGCVPGVLQCRHSAYDYVVLCRVVATASGHRWQL